MLRRLGLTVQQEGDVIIARAVNDEADLVEHAEQVRGDAKAWHVAERVMAELMRKCREKFGVENAATPTKTN